MVLPRVLMLGTPGRTVLGRPYVPTAEVLVVVEEQVRDAKVIIFKKRRRKNSRRTAGHRQVSESLSMACVPPCALRLTCRGAQQLTALRVLDIVEKVA